MEVVAGVVTGGGMGVVAGVGGLGVLEQPITPWAALASKVAWQTLRPYACEHAAMSYTHQAHVAL